MKYSLFLHNFTSLSTKQKQGWEHFTENLQLIKLKTTNADF